MNEQEFEKQLNALHERVLSKALSDEEKIMILSILVYTFSQGCSTYAASCNES